MIHNVKRDNEEIKHGTFSSNNTIMFSLNVDFSFSDLSLLLLFSNFNSSLLGLIKILDKFSVIKNSGRIGFRERLKKIRFELIKSDSIFILLLHKILLSHFEFILFNVDDHCNELFFKTTFSDDEVNNCTLGSNFRTEVRVDELSHKEELEAGIIINWVTTNFQLELVTILLNSTLEKRIKGSINFLLDTFNEDCTTRRNTAGKSTEPLRLTERDSCEVFKLFSSNPSRTLELGINNKRPTSTSSDNGCIFKRHRISRKTFIFPLRFSSFSSKNLQRFNTFSHRNTLFNNIR